MLGFLLAFFSCLGCLKSFAVEGEWGLPLYYWQAGKFVNFGDYISLKLVERIVGCPVEVPYGANIRRVHKLLAIGSIFYFASTNDVVWGSGINGKTLRKTDYKFSSLDVRAVRGPLTKQFLWKHFQIVCPEIYGDPALLFPYFFPEFKKNPKPSKEYVVIPHYSEEALFPKSESTSIVYATDPWDYILRQILDSKFVISSSLHGVVVAEAYGIPARLLRVTNNEPFFKFQDYYYGTNRPYFQYATSVEEALQMGGESPPECNLQKLYEAFPFEYWPHIQFKTIDFSKNNYIYP